MFGDFSMLLPKMTVISYAINHEGDKSCHYNPIRADYGGFVDFNRLMSGEEKKAKQGHGAV